MPRSASANPHRLDEPVAAAALADGGGDLLRDVEPIGREVDVVGDERHARADDDGAGAGMRRRGAEVGRPARRGHLGRQPLELAAPDVLEVPAGRIGGCLLVQVHRHAEARRDGGAGLPGQRHAVGHRRALDRHEGDDVDGAQARVLAAVRPEVDVGDGPFDERQDGSLDAVGVAGEGEDGTVVRRVRGMVEQADAFDAPHGVGHGRDDLGPASFAHVGNAFDEHEKRLIVARCAVLPPRGVL